MIEIPLTLGKVAIVDDCDAHLAAHRWHAYKSRNTWYAARKVRRPDGRWSTSHLHREVLGVTDPAVEIDHRDGDGLDCRRRNLRAATTQRNQANSQRRSDNTSGFKGVSWSAADRRWRAHITTDGKKRRHLGRFASPVEAARAYDAAASRQFGEFARLNFPAEATR